MGKAKIFRRCGYGFLALLYSVGFLSLLFMPLPKAEALTASNFVVAPGDPNVINSAYSQGGSLVGSDENYFKRQGLSQVNILVRDFPELGSFAIPYDPQRSEEFGKNFQGAGRDDDISGVGELFFTFEYYCSVPGGKISQTPATNGVAQYKVEYAVGLFPLISGAGQGGVELANDFAAKDSYRIASGPVQITRSYDVSEGRANTVTNLWDDENAHKIGPQDLTGRLERMRGSGIPASCLPNSALGEGNIRNYNKLSEAAKAPFAEAAAAIAPADGTVGAAQPDCDVKLTSPISWIICPVIDIMAGFSDFVFSGIVKPLLADVPISTDPNDGGYKAWQQFRLLGNVVLVGAMIAVVYAQIKGG